MFWPGSGPFREGGAIIIAGSAQWPLSGIVTLCIGGGQGIALAIEAIS